MATWFSNLFRSAPDKSGAQGQGQPCPPAAGSAAQGSSPGNIPHEDQLRQKLEHVLDTAINPAIAAHGGYITLEKVVGNDVYITMQGGCQGCAASRMTLRMGVEQAFRDAVPELGEVVDVTDHSSGLNPYYSDGGLSDWP